MTTEQGGQQMYLWLVSQNVNTDYDTFDSVVVSAPDENTARNMNPSKFAEDLMMNWDESFLVGWASRPEDVQVEKLGPTHKPQGVILASFNAG